MYQTGGTIKETLDQIGSGSFVLPAIQREFVWKPAQICKFYDSLMQGYPFGTFLYWRVAEENVGKFKFYEFMRHYHERDNPHCASIEDLASGPLTAVLDGQQRLTALNIGLRGTMAWKLPNKWWNNASAFPQRKLYLDLLSGGEPDENGNRYRFAFLTNDQLAQQGDERCWFPVPSIMQMKGAPAMLKWLNERLPQDKTEDAFEVLDQLYQVIHNHHLVAYYEEKGQELEKVLNIFIRMNSGGTVLSYSDLLLSIAVAQWDKYDARDEIHTLVDELNRIGDGFDFSKDLVLKAGLMLSDIGNVGFKVENFNKANMAILEKKWSSIKDALLLTVQLLSSFGFNGQTIRADSAILPIAYYLHSRSLGEAYLAHSSYEKDREAIREWFIRSLLKSSGIWGSGLDTLLTALRDTIRAHGSDHFPYCEIREVMTRRGKSIGFEPEEIEELVDMTYGDKRLFALLSLTFPFIKHQHVFHVDHVFPKGRFTTRNLLKAGFKDSKVEDVKENSDKLANLQLLLGAINNEKRKKMPLEWIDVTYPDAGSKQQYIQQQMLGGLSNDLSAFPDFYEQRRSALKERIAKLVNVTQLDIDVQVSGQVGEDEAADGF
ncbi:DUF262 domain-containing protein [Celeribacter halophilus]|jgi:hypothetical protein|uniref:DUF262 domain-containing protein n=1 Tax=Celeribacter halophilus TaxID=576117 RepID=UPI003A951E4D